MYILVFAYKIPIKIDKLLNIYSACIIVYSYIALYIYIYFLFLNCYVPVVLPDKLVAELETHLKFRSCICFYFIQPPKRKITDPEELEEYKLKKRKVGK